MHELRTVAGTQRAGTVSVLLRIEGRMVWRGEAVAIPGSPQAEEGAAGLLPALDDLVILVDGNLPAFQARRGCAHIPPVHCVLWWIEVRY